MSVSGVAAVWVPVEDMQRAIAFYGDTLGLTVQKHDDDWAEVDANGLRVGLNAREAEGARDGGGAVITFQPEGGIEQAKQELEADGVALRGRHLRHPWGRIATFKDSEGNDLQLYSPLF